MSILKSASVVSGSTLLSRILGMVRDVACASVLGAGATWDAFVIAWRIPNLFRRILGEGAVTSAFVPVFSGERERGGARVAFEFFANVLTLLTIVLTALTLFGVVTAMCLPPSWFGAGDSARKAALTLSLLEILFPYVLVVNVMALFAALLNSLDHFFAPAIAPAVLNVFWIGGALLAPKLATGQAGRVRVVAFAILAGGIVQLLIQVPFVVRRRVPLRPRFRVRDPAVGRMLLLLVPMMLGLAPVQVNVLLDTLIAEVFVPGNGANSHLFYGNRLVQFPLALIGIAMGVVVFPRFARQAKAKRLGDLGRSLSEALRFTFFLALPAAAGLLALAAPLVALIFEHGRFGVSDAFWTSRVLAFYALGVPAYCGLQVVTRLYYAVEDVRTPVRVGASMVLVNLTLNLLLVGPMREAGLALATSVSAALNLLVLSLLARRRLNVEGFREAAASFVPNLLLSAGMGTAVFFFSTWLAGRLPGRTVFHELVWVLPPLALGVVLHFGLALLFRRPEALRLLRWSGSHAGGPPGVDSDR